MKEKDLEKCLDNLIIEGLIKEAEQDNAEFEAALRNMSDEDFLQLISQDINVEVAEPSHLGASEPAYSELIFEDEEFTLSHSPIKLNKARKIADSSPCVKDGFNDASPTKSKSKQSTWKPWVAAIASAAAILVIVLIPTFRYIDSRVCESTLLASSSYKTPSRGGNDIDIASLSKAKVLSMIPKLQEQYESLEPVEEMYVLDEPEDVVSEDYYIEATDQKEAGMQLVQAYLRTNQKVKAVELLHELSDKYGDSDFGNQCKKLLEILE